MLQSLLKFTNPHRPYAAHAPQAYPHPFLLCVWRPAGSEAPAPPPRRWEPLAIEALPKTHHMRSVHLRWCCVCGKVRVLPRYLDPVSFPADNFRCSDSPDVKYGVCDAPEFVFAYC